MADRIISELASLLEVALKPDEVEALELERQLMAEDRKQQTLPAQQGTCQLIVKTLVGCIFYYYYRM